jgi:hypothetical protein
MVWCAVFTMSSAAYGQTNRWYASADLLRATVHGNDRHAGDVITSDVTLAGDTNDFSSTDFETVRAIAPRLRNTTSFMVEAGRHGTAWGFGGRVWRVSTDASAGERTTSAPAADGVFHSTAVRLWNSTFLPLPDMSDASGLAPLEYDTHNALEHVRAEGYAQRGLLTAPTLSMDVRFGLGYARSEHRQIDRLTTRGVAAQGTTDESLMGASDATADLVGPLVALAGSNAFHRVSVGWLISATALAGTAHDHGAYALSAVTQTLSDAGIVTAITGADRRQTIAEDTRHLVPAVDLQLDASYHIAKDLEVGGRVFSSSLFNTPSAPEFDGQQFAWHEHTNDVAFLAYSAFARVTF